MRSPQDNDVVECIDDEPKPDHPTWLRVFIRQLKKGRLYRIAQVVRYRDGGVGYSLQGVDDPPLNWRFSAQRFRPLERGEFKFEGLEERELVQ